MYYCLFILFQSTILLLYDISRQEASMYAIHIPSNNKNDVLQFKCLYSSTQNPQRSLHLRTYNFPPSICISKTNCVLLCELHLILTHVFPYGTVHGAMCYTCPPGFPFSIPYSNMSQLTIYYNESQTPRKSIVPTRFTERPSE